MKIEDDGTLESSTINNNRHEQQSVIIHEEHYYALKPQKNPLFCILEDLKNYRVTLKNLPEELSKKQIHLYVPEQLSKLRIIIEYNDCILQANDLINYVELQDEKGYSSLLKNGERNSSLYGPKSMTSTGAILTGQKIPGKFDGPIGDKKLMDSEKASLIN